MMKIFHAITIIFIPMLFLIALEIKQPSIEAVFARRLYNIARYAITIFITFPLAKAFCSAYPEYFGFGYTIKKSIWVMLTSFSFAGLNRMKGRFPKGAPAFRVLSRIVLAFAISVIFITIVFPPRVDYKLQASANITRNPNSSIYYYNEDMHLFEPLVLNGRVDVHYTNTDEYVLIYEGTFKGVYEKLLKPVTLYVLNINDDIHEYKIQ